MIILICGDRNWTNETLIEDILLSIPEIDTVIHGDCKDADKIGGKIAKKLGFKIKIYPADWSLGKKAGPLRNTQMLEENNIDLVLAFHDNIKESKGTKNMITQSRKKNIITFLINSLREYEEFITYFH